MAGVSGQAPAAEQLGWTPAEYNHTKLCLNVKALEFPSDGPRWNFDSPSVVGKVIEWKMTIKGKMFKIQPVGPNKVIQLIEIIKILGFDLETIITEFDDSIWLGALLGALEILLGLRLRPSKGEPGNPNLQITHWDVTQDTIFSYDRLS